MMQGFGVHTFRLVNAEGKSTFVKFHWTPKLGIQSVVWDEAENRLHVQNALIEYLLLGEIAEA